MDYVSANVGNFNVDMSIKSIYLILMQCLPGNKQVLGL